MLPHAPSKINTIRLETYFREMIGSNNSRLVINTDLIRISNIMRLGGGSINDIYSFLLTYNERDKEKHLPLVLKIFRENVDPIFNSYIHDRDIRMCVREWEALTNLERAGYAAPRAYVCECNSRFLGYPFLIMEKLEKSKRNINDLFDRFALCLADLHNLEIEKMQLVNLKTPRDGYAFARRWPLHFKHALNLETKHRSHLKRKFDFTIRWLESHALNNYCPKYSLIHGDAHPANTILTDDLRLTLIDWETVDVGDPAFDVAYAYHTIKFFSNPQNPDSAEQIAKRFLSQYLKKSKVDVRPRLDFYEVIAIFGYAVLYSSALSSPIKAYKFHRHSFLPSLPILALPLILLAFPFLRWPFVARQINAEGELYELRYFEKFIEKLH